MHSIRTRFLNLGDRGFPLTEILELLIIKIIIIYVPIEKCEAL